MKHKLDRIGLAITLVFVMGSMVGCKTITAKKQKPFDPVKLEEKGESSSSRTETTPVGEVGFDCSSGAEDLEASMFALSNMMSDSSLNDPEQEAQAYARLKQRLSRLQEEGCDRSEAMSQAIILQEQMSVYFERDEAQASQCAMLEEKFIGLLSRYVEASDPEAVFNELLPKHESIASSAADYVALEHCSPELRAFFQQLLADYQDFADSIGIETNP